MSRRRLGSVVDVTRATCSGCPIKTGEPSAVGRARSQLKWEAVRRDVRSAVRRLQWALCQRQSSAPLVDAASHATNTTTHSSHTRTLTDRRVQERVSLCKAAGGSVETSTGSLCHTFMK